MKTLFKIFTSKILIMLIIIALQILIFMAALYFLNEKIPYFYIITGLISALLTIYIVSNDINPAYKIAWIIPILALPVFGVGAYALFGKKRLSRKKMRNYRRATEGIYELIGQNDNIMNELKNEDMFFYDLSRYIFKDSKYPVYKYKTAKYFKSGEEYFEILKIELKKAKKYIFLEFFIISLGEMWNSVLEILKQKINEGVEVRLIYDDVGTLLRLPHNYHVYLENLGIKLFLFNKFRPIADSQMNNRTHRKIVVIDGNTAFTGGINLADEYINKKEMYGNWKDTGVMVKGECVKNFTMMFLTIWCVKYGKEDFSKYQTVNEKIQENNYIIPFSDSPSDNRNVYENSYLKMIYNAKEYIYINTPYLVIDNEIKTALITAARSGVDVRITVPYKPDKFYVFILTRAFYTELIKGGVKIYQYTPGFIHAKSIICDDKFAIIGTSNMDFRSFYLHFECGAAIYSREFISDMKKDYEDTILISEEITKDMTKTSLFYRVVQAVLRLFAPLM